MNPPPLRVAVVGAGIGGLVTAYRLQNWAKASQRRVELTVFEAIDRPGGVIQTRKRDGFLLESGPDCFISEKPAGLALVKELGLESELIGTQENYRKSFVVKNGQLYPVPEGFYLMAPSSFWPFLRSPLLSWPGKLRVASEVFRPRCSSQNDESLGSFVRRRFGQEVLDRVAQPMIAGIYTADPENLSLQATMPRFMELERKYGSVIRGLRAKKAQPSGTSGPRYGLFLSFREGMSTLTKTLVEKIGTGVFLFNQAPTSIVPREGGRWEVATAEGKKEFDAVFLSLTAYQAARLVSGLPSLSNKLLSISYASVATLQFAYRENQIGHAAQGMGFVSPSKEKRIMVGCSFCHRKFIQRAPEGHALLRVFVGGAMHENILDQTDVDLVKTVQKDIHELLSITGEPLFTEVSRWKKAMPQYRVGHLDQVSLIESEVSKHPGLYLVGNGYTGVGIPDVTARANSEVERWIRTLN